MSELEQLGMDIRDAVVDAARMADGAISDDLVRDLHIIHLDLFESAALGRDDLVRANMIRFSLVEDRMKRIGRAAEWAAARGMIDALYTFTARALRIGGTLALLALFSISLPSCALLGKPVSMIESTDSLRAAVAELAAVHDRYVSDDAELGAEQLAHALAQSAEFVAAVNAGEDMIDRDFWPLVLAVTARTDAYVISDGSLIELERRTYLGLSADLRKLSLPIVSVQTQARIAPELFYAA